MEFDHRCAKVVNMLNTKVMEEDTLTDLLEKANEPVKLDTIRCRCVLPHNHPGPHIVEFKGERWPVDKR